MLIGNEYFPKLSYVLKFSYVLLLQHVQRDACHDLASHRRGCSCSYAPIQHDIVGWHASLSTIYHSMLELFCSYTVITS